LQRGVDLLAVEELERQHSPRRRALVRLGERDRVVTRKIPTEALAVLGLDAEVHLRGDRSFELRDHPDRVVDACLFEAAVGDLREDVEQLEIALDDLLHTRTLNLDDDLALLLLERLALAVLARLVELGAQSCAMDLSDGRGRQRLLVEPDVHLLQRHAE
jgi:hypothetical protein